MYDFAVAVKGGHGQATKFSSLCVLLLLLVLLLEPPRSWLQIEAFNPSHIKLPFNNGRICSSLIWVGIAHIIWILSSIVNILQKTGLEKC